MRLLIGFLSFLIPAVALADISLGSAAGNLNGVIAFIYEIIHVILYIGAGIMGMSGLLKLRLHKRNPQQMPISTPLTELSLCAVFVLLAVLAQMSISHKTVQEPILPTTSGPIPATSAPQPPPQPQPQNQYPY